MADVNKNNKGTRGIDISRVRESTAGLTDSAAMISRTADDVATGAESQAQALDSAVSVVNEMAASLKETAGLAESVAASTEELASTVNEVAASIEQITGNSTQVAATVNETAASSQETAASIKSVPPDSTNCFSAAICSSVGENVSVPVRCANLN